MRAGRARPGSMRRRSEVTAHVLIGLIGLSTCGWFGEPGPVRAEGVPSQNQVSSKPKGAQASRAKPTTAKSKATVAKPKPAKKKAKAAAQPKSQPAVSAAMPEAAAPLPAAASGAPPATQAAATRVEVPNTSHVHVDVPAGLQTWLNADDRMRPWLSKAVAATDSCYANERASNPSLAGNVAFTLTMHENARPSAAVNSVSAGLQGMVLCVTAKLMAVKMPLFTGNEGDAYTVRVQFDP